MATNSINPAASQTPRAPQAVKTKQPQLNEATKAVADDSAIKKTQSQTTQRAQQIPPVKNMGGQVTGTLINTTA